MPGHSIFSSKKIPLPGLHSRSVSRVEPGAQILLHQGGKGPAFRIRGVKHLCAPVLALGKLILMDADKDPVRLLVDSRDTVFQIRHLFLTDAGRVGAGEVRIPLAQLQRLAAQQVQGRPAAG